MAVNKVRRNGSYAPLSAHYYKDAALMAAGEKAEVVYTRSLAFCAEILSDGFVADVQIPLFTIGLTGVKLRIAALVRVGLWERDDRRKGYVVRSWLKWNRSRDEIADAMEKDTDRKRPRSDSDRKPDGDPPDSDPPPESVPNGFQPHARTPPPPPRNSTPRHSTSTADGGPPPPDREGAEEVSESELIEAVLTVRPGWTADAVQQALGEADVRKRPWHVIVAAMLALAEDPESEAPGRLRGKGPWWNAHNAVRRGAETSRIEPLCGQCGPGRLVDTADGAAAMRCPRCHPQRHVGGGEAA